MVEDSGFSSVVAFELPGVFSLIVQYFRIVVPVVEEFEDCR